MAGRQLAGLSYGGRGSLAGRFGGYGPPVSLSDDYLARAARAERRGERGYAERLLGWALEYESRGL